MEKSTALSPFVFIKEYFQLAKPGIILGNIINAAVGIALASHGTFTLSLFFGTLSGLVCVIASACMYNNYIDRECDRKMARTRHRPLAQGTISGSIALVVATLLALLGAALLVTLTNIIATAMAFIGFFIYVVIYSLLKYHSSHATWIGSLAGAMPPVVGYCAASGRCDLTAALLFGTIALWQMPHFFAISLYRLDDYAAAAIPVLPLVKGVRATKIQMLLYIVAFTIVCSSLTLFGYVGSLHLVTTVGLGLIWSLLCIQGIKGRDGHQWARKMFVFSLIVVMALCMTIPFSAAY